MFIGEYHHTLDDKGRLAIPKKYQAQFKKGAVVTRGIDQCLFLFPADSWKQLAEKLSALPISQSNPRAFARLMFGGAMDAELDGNGRIVLPEYLRQYAKLNKQVVVAGLYSRIELWDEEAWEQYKLQAETNSVDIAEQMRELGV
ncbi:division/cell wall cluster transcriptional repressor MraZ [Candidatus Uhrbacteria bacterium]|nr:division/cell wall cluster transcriptional repressor MraZ [Candidatus Uhrbacteria bacterium]